MNGDVDGGAVGKDSKKKQGDNIESIVKGRIVKRIVDAERYKGECASGNMEAKVAV
jgi:hypothetical protein